MMLRVLLIAIAVIVCSTTSTVGTPLPQPRYDSQASLLQLMLGNRRFAAGESTGGQSLSHALRIGEFPMPFATILTCADSRLVPELIFDCSVGDLEVIRIQGNVADPLVIASVEFNSYPRLVVVLGHTDCAALLAAERKPELNGNEREIVLRAGPALSDTVTRSALLQDDEGLTVAEENVRQTIAHLLDGSDRLRQEVEAGILIVAGGIYDVDTGLVAWLKDTQAEHLQADAVVRGYVREIRWALEEYFLRQGEYPRELITLVRMGLLAGYPRNPYTEYIAWPIVSGEQLTPGHFRYDPHLDDEGEFTGYALTGYGLDANNKVVPIIELCEYR